MSAAGVLQGLRPYLWLALTAFLVGFLSYLAFGGAHVAMRPEAQHAPKVSAPATDDWNLPKHI
jgi:hypothetical protein